MCVILLCVALGSPKVRIRGPLLIDLLTLKKTKLKREEKEKKRRVRKWKRKDVPFGSAFFYFNILKCINFCTITTTVYFESSGNSIKNLLCNFSLVKTMFFKIS